jgi:hypothetical protein
VGQAGQAGADWSNITGWQLSVTTNTNGGASFSVNGLYLQWGYGPSSFSGVGYDWRQTYYNANTGTESSPNPTQEFNTDFGYLASTSAPIFLRQAAQVVGQYSFDPQVTHVRLYRRGGTLNDNWVQTVQAPNITGGGQFVLKDVIGDAFIQQAQPLVLDNDPPVTSSLVNPIQTTLANATTLMGLSSIYSTFAPQNVNVVQAGAVFVPNQLVEIGNANNLEVVAVISGGTGTFTAILRLMHNQGEPVNVYAVPRQPCNLCATAYNQVWLAGDPNNPHYLYFSKPGLPENFGPQNYIPVGTPNAPINAIINWRGTLFVGTTETWWIIPGSQRPPQPTGSVHGIVAQNGWIEVEGAIWYQCLPMDESEILTRYGWKTRDELEIGEDVLAYDIETKTCRWSPVEAINVYDYDGDLTRIVNKNGGLRFDFSCTPDHKWVWKPELRTSPYDENRKAHPNKFPRSYNQCDCGCIKARYAKCCKVCTRGRGEKLKPASKLSASGNVVQAAPLYTNGSLLSPREAAILGWIVTDGSISRNNGRGRRSARIHQAETSKHVGKIVELLADDLMSTYRQPRTSGYGAANGKICIELDFAMGTDFTEYLLQKAGFESRKDLPQIICGLDPESCRSMLEAMISADGSRGKSTSFTQKKNPVMEPFRILAFLCGHPTGDPKYHTDTRRVREMGRVTVIQNPNIDCQGLKKTLRHYKGKVWCPTTKYGTWVARSNGTISITGNSADGLREFTGAEGVYKTLPVEWIFRGNPQCLPPQADPTQFSQTVMAFYNNTVFASYVSLNSGQRYRLIYDTQYQRFRQDDIAATAMLWEKDTNALLVGKQISPGNYAVVQDQVGDYDDGGWNGSALIKTPINITIQHPYRDLGKPHQPKQWNMIDTDVNTQNQVLQTTLLFEDGAISIPLAAQDTGFARQKCEMIVTGAGQPQGGGQQAYRASILHTMVVTVAPTIYQEDIYAALVAEYNGSLDTYWEKFGTDQSKFVKQGYFDYTSPVALNVSLYADGSSTTYWTFTLPAAPNRAVQRVRFGNLNPGTTAFTMRTWRMIVLTSSVENPLESFQLWAKPRIEFKIAGNNSYQVKELDV